MSNDPSLAQLLADGRMAEAEAVCQRRLETDPEDLPALKIVALGAWRCGDARRARELLEQASRLDLQDALTLHHLGRACEALGDFAGALSADEAAVRADPDSHTARLCYAMGLEREGDQERSFLQFARALKGAQEAGEWLDPATTPPALQAAVEHAVRVVRAGRRSALDRVLTPLIGRYGHSELARVSAALRIYLGEQHPAYPDPRQRPKFFYIPGLPTSPYFDRRLFAWLPAYEALCEAIKHELLSLLPTERTRERVFGSQELEAENLRGEAPSWNGYYFYRHGEQREENRAACPITARALDALPLIRVREHGPEVLYSVFAPGTDLLPHRGVTNARLVTHLPLIVPPNCALSVGGEVHAWREGRVVVFDDTYEHAAWNRSSAVRVVLIADIWHPYLSEAERAAITEIIPAIGDLRVATEAS
jgi:aspartate beta-hydroxylase